MCKNSHFTQAHFSLLTMSLYRIQGHCKAIPRPSLDVPAVPRGAVHFFFLCVRAFLGSHAGSWGQQWCCRRREQPDRCRAHVRQPDPLLLVHSIGRLAVRRYRWVGMYQLVFANMPMLHPQMTGLCCFCPFSSFSFQRLRWTQ